MPSQDRTHEFRACVDSIRNRSAAIASRAHPKPATPNGASLRDRKTSKSEFSRLAMGIGRDITNTTTKLGKLAQLAKRKTLFDDRPVEISELTYIIKQDIANINKQIASLQNYVKAQGAASRAGAGKQVDEHNSNVVMLLQSKLANTSMTFKDVLEIRTQNMKESKDRTEQFMHSTASAAVNAPPTNSLLFNQRTNDSGSILRSDTKGKGRAQDPDLLTLDMATVEEGGMPSGGGYMQMQLVEQQDDYIQTRSTAIESIESTIAELGSIFSQLAHMVAEQRETVQRIDADTIDIANNVSGAQRELLKYYENISSNRWLMIKVFGVLIVFFLLFILVS
ncbi:hypothetical protein BOTBODRAFT_29968 [Botryobasidium botryosum FD-172 SS1]|uniref:t-SNARE coiled-coil homology domain-containing protein n=1 Tax=Botryobasidium botryosum (strain FD-172 SS1) TaxID=930990 RepID=A0A067N256_BOTB1|nr:hypothetical protein BOTBODRAFT_29968 [Botryobasidium botryosum FD-172 SS1]